MPVATPLDDPRNPTPTLETQITAAITEGFEGASVGLLRGFDTILRSNTAVLTEMTGIKNDLTRRMDMIVRSATDASVIGRGIGGVAPTAASGNPSARAARAANVRRTSIEPTLPLGVETAAPSESRVRRTSTEQPTEVAPQSEGRVRRLNYDIDAGAGHYADQTRKGLRDSVYRMAAGRVEQAVGAEPVGPTADALGRYHNAQGRFVNAADVAGAAAEETSWKRKALLGQGAMRSLDAWKGGAPIGRALASALPAGALKAAGGVGLAISAGNQALQWTQGQYAQNREYQAVYGGSNLDQLDDRADRWVNKNITGRFSMLGGENYDKLFGGAMDLGLRGGDRSRYISGGAELMNTGADASQVAQMFGAATEAGQSLNGFTEAIRAVNASAKEAGINARKARDMFIKNYETSNEVLFGGVQGAKGMAQVLTQGQLAQGRQYQDIDPTGAFAGMDRQRFLAAQAGQTASEFVMSSAADPNSLIVASEEQQKRDLRMLTSENGTGKNIEQVVAEFMDSHPDYNATFDQVELGEALIEAGFLPDAIQRMLAADNIQVTEADAAGYAGNLFTDESLGAIATEASAATTASYKTSTFDTDTARDVFMGGINGRVATTPSEVGVMEAYLGGSGVGDAEGRTRSPVIEQLLGQYSELGLDDHGTKVLVDTKDGRRVVDLKWAIANVPDQIQAGTVKFVEGVDEEAQGRSVASVLGLSDEVLADYQDPASAGVATDEGQSLTDYEKEHGRVGLGETEGTTSSVVTFELTDEAKRLLQPTSTDPYQTGPSTPTGYVGDAQGNPD